MSYPTYVPTIGNKLTERIDDEVSRARRRFPENKHMLAALMEEVGELSQALIDHHHGKQTRNHVGETTAAHVLHEAIQVAGMAIRIAQEGDADFSYVCPDEDIKRP